MSLGFSCQRPSARALERNEAAIQRWKKTRWPALKKTLRKQGRIIVFIDESGLSERPTRVRTWAPRGQTPVLQYHFNWHQLSVIAGISFRRFYFRLFPGAIKGPQIIEFLQALGRQIRKPLLVIWDGLPVHRSALVREYLEALNGAIQVEQLPAYAPELNPAEYIWGHLKHHELANHCAGTFADLTTHARNRLRSISRGVLGHACGDRPRWWVVVDKVADAGLCISPRLGARLAGAPQEKSSTWLTIHARGHGQAQPSDRVPDRLLLLPNCAAGLNP